jgi:hypothetical protein
MQEFVELPGAYGEDPSISEAQAESPEWKGWTTSLTIAVFVTTAALVVWIILRRRSAKKSSLDLLAREAQGALTRLDAGEDLNNTILRCYREMSRTVLQQRHIRRALSVTPREFEPILVKNGLPAEAVHNLSQLFEMVRYGELTVSKAQEQLARICLQDIIEACQKAELTKNA